MKVTKRGMQYLLMKETKKALLQEHLLKEYGIQRCSTILKKLSRSKRRRTNRKLISELLKTAGSTGIFTLLSESITALEVLNEAPIPLENLNATNLLQNMSKQSTLKDTLRKYVEKGKPGGINKELTKALAQLKASGNNDAYKQIMKTFDSISSDAKVKGAGYNRIQINKATNSMAGDLKAALSSQKATKAQPTTQTTQTTQTQTQTQTPKTTPTNPPNRAPAPPSAPKGPDPSRLWKQNSTKYLEVFGKEVDTLKSQIDDIVKKGGGERKSTQQITRLVEKFHNKIAQNPASRRAWFDAMNSRRPDATKVASYLDDVANALDKVTNQGKAADNIIRHLGKQSDAIAAQGEKVKTSFLKQVNAKYAPGGEVKFQTDGRIHQKFNVKKIPGGFNEVYTGKAPAPKIQPVSSNLQVKVPTDVPQGQPTPKPTGPAPTSTPAPAPTPKPTIPDPAGHKILQITDEMVKMGSEIPDDTVKAFMKTSAGEELAQGIKTTMLQYEKETGKKLGSKVLLDVIDEAARGALVALGHGQAAATDPAKIAAALKAGGSGFKPIAFKFTGGFLLGLGLTAVFNWLMGKPTDALITKTDVAISAGTTALFMKFPALGPASIPLILAVGAISLSEYFAGDMTNIYTNVMKSAKSNLGLTYGAYKGGYDFTADKDFWKIADEKGYPDGVLRPSDVDEKRKNTILAMMNLASAHRRKLLPKDEMAKYENAKMKTDNPIGQLNMLFVNGALNQNAWGKLWKKTFRPNSGKIEVITLKDTPEAATKKDDAGTLKDLEKIDTTPVPDPGKKETIKFNWTKYVGNNPITSDKQQIKALWINKVAEMTGNKKSFNAWVSWYNTLRKTGKVGIGNQAIMSGSPVKSGDDDRVWEKGNHMSPDQVEFIMRRIYQGHEIKPQMIAGKKDLKEYKQNLRQLILAL